MSDRGEDRYTYAPGTELPGTPYRVERHIGVGGMGSVYAVRHTFLDRLEALKTIHPELVERKDIAKRMRHEAQVVGKLRHPNIVQVTGGGIIEDEYRLPYFAMEMLRGKNLRDVMKRNTLADVASIYSIATEVLSALAEAHARGVIHRDVKPENIFLHFEPTRSAGPTITTKLLDFGVMALLGGRQSMAFRGTYRYAAPEQLRGEQVSPQTDIYAMALVIYEMLAHRGPFDDERDWRALVKAHMEREAPPITKFVRSPAALEQLLARALSKNPAERPATAMAFAQELFILKQMHENRPVALANDTEESWLTTVASPSERSMPASPESAKEDIRATRKEGARARSAAEPAREPDTTREDLLPAGMIPQGGTLEDAEVPTVSGATPRSRMPAAFAKTHLDRAAVTRTADPVAEIAPKNDTEPIPPVRSSDTVPGTWRSADLEAFLMEESAGPDVGAPSATPPPVARSRHYVDTLVTPAPRRRTPGRTGLALAAAAAMIIAAGFVWKVAMTKPAATHAESAPPPAPTQAAAPPPEQMITAPGVPEPAPVLSIAAPTASIAPPRKPTPATRPAPARPSAPPLPAAAQSSATAPPPVPTAATIPAAPTGDPDLKRTFVH
jgi:serine/threonine-protein kinase